jgi:hypothetical protein
MMNQPIGLSSRALAAAAGASAVAEQEQRRRVVEGDVRVRAWRSWFGRIGFHGIVDGTRWRVGVGRWWCRFSSSRVLFCLWPNQIRK